MPTSAWRGVTFSCSDHVALDGMKVWLCALASLGAGAWWEWKYFGDALRLPDRWVREQTVDGVWGRLRVRYKLAADDFMPAPKHSRANGYLISTAGLCPTLLSLAHRPGPKQAARRGHAHRLATGFAKLAQHGFEGLRADEFPEVDVMNCRLRIPDSGPMLGLHNLLLRCPEFEGAWRHVGDLVPLGEIAAAGLA